MQNQSQIDGLMKGDKMKRVYNALLEVLHDAGLIVNIGEASTTEIMAALIEYEEKYDAMLEHVLMQKD